MLLNDASVSFKNSVSKEALTEYEQILMEELGRGTAMLEARVASSAPYVIDYTGHGHFSKRVIKSNDSVRVMLERVRVGRRSIILVLKPANMDSAYKVSNNDKWRLEVQMDHKDYKSLDGDLVEQINENLMRIITGVDFDVGHVDVKDMVPRFIKRIKSSGLRWQGTTTATASEEKFLWEHYDSEEVGDFA